MTRQKQATGPNKLPDKAEILAFIRDHEGRVGKREIARAFQIKGAARAELKQVLSDLAEEGAISRHRRKLARPGALPPVAVIEITGCDEDGELIASPLDWIREDEGPTPLINIAAQRTRPPTGAAGVGERVLARLTLISEKGPEGRLVYEARIIKRLAKAAVRTLGVYRALPGGRGRIEPIDRRNLKEFAVGPDEVGDANPGDLVSIEVSGETRARAPRARIVESHGPLGSQKTISKIAIQTHEIPEEFPPAALAEAQSARGVGADGREDLRQIPLITIDPSDARDHDDAVWAAPDSAADNPGGFVVLVAIADVAHYVRTGSALDKAARERGNSVYFPDRVVPMLPERISTDLCSLKQGTDRPCLAVRMVFGADGRKRSHRFMRGIMRSAAKLSYEQAQAAIDGTVDETTRPLLEPILTPLWGAYQALKRGREARAPLELDLPERKVVLKADGSIDRIIVPPRLDAHRLIEEFMIQANVAAAETLETKQSPLLYRVHEAPSKIKLDALRDFLKTLEIQLPKAGTLRPAHFNRILTRVEGSDIDQLVNEVVLRSQAQAGYSPAKGGHFGLNLHRYAHFTSPIRRYADLIVHRALIRALRLGRDGLSDETIAALDEIGAQISAAERRAMAAERDTLDRLIAHHLASHVGALFSARISGVTRYGLFVRLAESGADGFIPAKSLTSDYFRLDERRQALIGDRTGEMHRIGDKVEARLVEAVPLAGALRFDLISEGQYVKARKSGRAGPEKRPVKRRRR
jgi:ribonuclease R